MNYHETQRMNTPWAWYAALLFIALVSVFHYYEGHSLLRVVPFALLTALALGFFYFCRLDTEVSGVGIQYRMKPFHLTNRMIEWKDVQRLYIRKYHPFWEYRGWGINWGKAGWAYTVYGNTGIQLVLKSGKKILVGTQKPHELNDYLTKLREKYAIPSAGLTEKRR